MAFWSTEKIKARQIHDNLVLPYEERCVQQGAYELKMGAQAAISCDGANRIAHLEPREVFCIPRGQFAVLVTEERVTVPADAVGLISLKTSFKSRGLVNVSGFHVDPGYACRLKFWVYNAGNEDIHVLRGEELFLIWFTDLDQKTEDVYKKNSPSHDELTGDDLRKLHGTLSSPAALAKQIEALEGKVRIMEWIGGTALVVLIGLCIALATPLLDYILKPVIERFAKANPPTLAAPAAPSPATGLVPAANSPASVPANSTPAPAAPPPNNPSQAPTPKQP